MIDILRDEHDTDDDIIEAFVQVTIPEDKNFLQVAETLTRVCIINEKSCTRFQPVFILHKKGKYYIVHYKELLYLDGYDVHIEESDYSQRNDAINKLVKWGLVDVVDKELALNVDPKFRLSIIKSSEKDELNHVPLYKIGSD